MVPESKTSSSELETESANFLAIEKLPGRFLMRGGRGERGRSPGGISSVRGGLPRRRHGDVVGCCFFLCSHRKEERYGEKGEHGDSQREEEAARVQCRGAHKMEWEWLAWWWRVTSPGR
jgi:hypothetical protein